MSDIRDPAVAGFFYPGAADALLEEVDRYLAADAEPQDALAVVLPHAGYVYSGPTAGSVLAGTNVPRRVILLGPKHRGGGARVALSAATRWRLPFGEVPIDRELGEQLLATGAVELDDVAHRDEHSLEVQVPFLWRRNPELLLTPIALGLHTVEVVAELGRALADVIAALDEPVLLAASTDMSHHIPLAEAERLDRLALEPLLARDPERLYSTVMGHGITMCGVIPTTAVLFAANALGASSADLVRYTTSAEASGDTSRVVGYAGVIVR